MLKRLSRDYWHPSVRRPYLRTLLAFVLAPVIVTAIMALCMFVLETMLSGELSTDNSRTLVLMPYMLVASYAILLTLGLVMFAILWSVRCKSKLKFIAAGMAVGLLAGLASPLISGQPMGFVPIIVMTIFFGIAMLVVRQIAGIRRVG